MCKGVGHCKEMGKSAGLPCSDPPVLSSDLSERGVLPSFSKTFRVFININLKGFTVVSVGDSRWGDA